MLVFCSATPSMVRGIFDSAFMHLTDFCEKFNHTFANPAHTPNEKYGEYDQFFSIGNRNLQDSAYDLFIKSFFTARNAIGSCGMKYF